MSLTKSKSPNRKAKKLQGHILPRGETLVLIIITLFKKFKILKINICNKPCQCRSTDLWVDDAIGELIVHR